ncbi:hypothetical protein BDN72DRAFT_962679 [Pluteus cervinus]|uniref:Uncharacterized protein n=1 Tax=Pluteus cervinus TaxID=181527 RepID=A0ACD3AH59_9AGAR|nr:hypothetical protein BDN72DRAFT_962679 [Pluteus cervinus]
MSSPRLPPELEHVIFLLAFQDDPRKAKHLLFIAKRVFNWLIPEAYKVVQFYEDRCLPVAFNESVYRKYGHHVRHLWLDTRNLRCGLTLFPNVTDLVLDSHYTPAQLLRLPLKRLSIWTDGPPTPELFQVFSTLTHLDLDTLETWSSHISMVHKLLYLPKLQYLCLVNGFPKHVLELFLDRTRCPDLEVVMVWRYKEGPQLVVEDQRVLEISPYPMRDWEAGVRGGMDMWKFADQAIASRKNGGCD